MSNTVVEGWTDGELVIARQAFDHAYERAVDQLLRTVQVRSAALDSADTLWALHDFLSIERHTMEGRFDFRLDGILFVFASLVKDGLLSIQELEGLTPDKLAKVSAMARF
jgi:hypothetical protein